jgi:hypothetical protein
MGYNAMKCLLIHGANVDAANEVYIAIIFVYQQADYFKFENYDKPIIDDEKSWGLFSKLLH